MSRFVVTWEIDAEDFGSPEAAARWAWATMRRPNSTANHFVVIDEQGKQHSVDLEDLDQRRHRSPLATTFRDLDGALRAMREAAE